MRVGSRGHTQIRSLNWVLSHRRPLQAILCHFRGLCYFLKFAGQVRLQFAFKQGHFQEAFPLVMMDWGYSSVPIPRDSPSVFDVLDQVIFFSDISASLWVWRGLFSPHFREGSRSCMKNAHLSRVQIQKEQGCFQRNMISVPSLLICSAHSSLAVFILVKSIWADSDLFLYVTH